MILITLSQLAFAWGDSPPTKFTATAYALRGTTASGKPVRHGVVAADPRVLKMGTRIRVTDAGGHSGVYTVADTGKHIRGNRLDIWVSSNSVAKKFGRRVVSVQRL